MSEQNPPSPTPTVSATGACPLLSKTVGRPGTESTPSTITQPDHPLEEMERSL